MQQKGKSILILVFLLTIYPVSAITGSIGNARAVITQELKGETITLDRTIEVNNVNNETLDIKLGTSPEIANLIKIIDKEFTLKPNESKKARYKLILTEQGYYEGKISIRFIPKEGNGIALVSTLIINVIGEGSGSNQGNKNKSNREEQSQKEEKEENSSFSFGLKRNDNKKNSSEKISPNTLETKKVNLNLDPLITFSIILLSIVIILGAIYYLRKK